MDKKAIEELKEALKKEILADIEKNSHKGDWKEYTDTELDPRLEKLYQDNRRVQCQLKTAINTIARLYNNKRGVAVLSKQEIEGTKELINIIFEYFEKRSNNEKKI